MCFKFAAGLLFVLVAASYSAAAEINSEVYKSHGLPVDGLIPRIEFWQGIFTKYGKNQSVFHFRNYPEVTYSVLDFSELEKSYSPATFEAKKKAALKDEEGRIKEALTHLAAGKTPRNNFETRIKKLVQSHVGKTASSFRSALEEEQIRSQTGIAERFKGGVSRSGRYLYAIEDIFQKEGLPLELGRLPLIESSFDYTAYSSVGAAGIWQFMRATATKYMRVNSSIDERRDPIIASRAAAKYLAHAYSRLQHWPLAITSYNHGVAGVMRAVSAVGSRDMRTLIDKYNGPTFGFASKNFYPEFVAAVDIEKNKFKFFPDLQLESPLYFDEVTLTKSAGFSDLARLAGLSKEDLARYNLSFQKPILNGGVRIPAGVVVKVPRGKGEYLKNSLRGRPTTEVKSSPQTASPKSSSVRASGGEYIVKKGDTLWGIAKANNTSADSLKRLNPSLKSGLKAGQKIKLP